MSNTNKFVIERPDGALYRGTAYGDERDWTRRIDDAWHYSEASATHQLETIPAFSECFILGIGASAPDNVSQETASALFDSLVVLNCQLQEAKRERDFLVSEYERAVKCGSQGYTHAAAHLYNAVVNAKCDANADRFIKLMDERDAALDRAEKAEKELADARDTLDPYPMPMARPDTVANGIKLLIDACQDAEERAEEATAALNGKLGDLEMRVGHLERIKRGK